MSSLSRGHISTLQLNKGCHGMGVISVTGTKWQHSGFDDQTVTLKHGAGFTSSALGITTVGVNWLPVKVADYYHFFSLSSISL